MLNHNSQRARGLTRRGVLRAGAAATGGLMLPAGLFAARAEDRPAIGSWPDGSSGSSVFIGITVPRTGTYALQGEDELKGYQLAIEHINSGDELIRKISPKTTKGVLGKEVKFGVADSEAKPNTAVQEQSRFITDHRFDLERGGRGAEQARATGKGSLRGRHLRL